MKLRRTSKANLGNKPHRGMGQWGRGKRMPGLMAGTHVAQRTNTGFDDRRGYKESPSLSIGKESGRAPKISREHGHYHPISTQNATRGYDKDVTRSRQLTRAPHTVRDMGAHTGPSPEGDTSRRRGAAGNGLGSGPPGIGKGTGVRGNPDSHLGTTGRGGTGRIGKSDAHKGKPTSLSEAPTHEWFESLGAK